MSLFGYNRASLNGGVSGIIAGAALVVATGTVAAEGVRLVYPSASVTCVSSGHSEGRYALQAAANIVSVSSGNVTGVRQVLGGAGFVTVTEATAFPALLQLQSANIVIGSSLKATPTDAWAYSSGQLTGTGFKTQFGYAHAAGIATVTAEAYAKAGFSSNITVHSSFSADPSIQLSGEVTWQREGYAQGTTSSSVTAEALRTALGYANAESTSYAITDSIKTHGGGAQITSVWETSVIASTDAAFIIGTSGTTAVGLLTAYGSATSEIALNVTADGLVTVYAEPMELSGVLTAVADARLALLGSSTFTGISDTTAAGRLALLGAANVVAVSAATSSGTRVKDSSAQVDCTSSATAAERLALLGAATLITEVNLTAIAGLLIESSAVITSSSDLKVFSYTNAESLDPEERTMYRSSVDRTMARPYIDRLMWRVP